MEAQELLLKTIFACMACDGDIAKEEIDLVRNLVKNTQLFNGFDVETKLNKYIESINKYGVSFLNQYLSELAETELTKEEELNIIDLAFKTIEADKSIEYSEVKFFKKIRVRIKITDEEIIEKYSDKEDFLYPDINVTQEPEWNEVIFKEISLKE